MFAFSQSFKDSCSTRSRELVQLENLLTAWGKKLPITLLSSPNKTDIIMTRSTANPSISPKQMVLRNNGHRHRLHPPAQPPLQQSLALLDLRHNIRPQRPPLHHIPPNQHLALHDLPRDLVRHGTASHAVAVPGDFPDGFGDDCEYDCVCVRPGVGGLGCDVC